MEVQFSLSLPRKLSRKELSSLDAVVILALNLYSTYTQVISFPFRGPISGIFSSSPTFKPRYVMMLVFRADKKK